MTTGEFLWKDPASGPSSFHVNLDPELRELGEVPRPNRDLVAFAVAVFLADRTVSRPRAWERDIELQVPVSAVSRWRALERDLAAMLNVLTSDRWVLKFEKRPMPANGHTGTRPGIDLVSLFSGGADSLCGVIRALSEDRRVILMSHWDWAGHSPYQKSLANQLTKRYPKQVFHRQIHLGRSARQLDGDRFSDEPTRRSRSLLFAGLGAAFAAVEPQVPLWIPENGYTSLNPPLAGERRGSLSTRTTHPLFLSDLRRITTGIGAHGELTNPFASMTKGEMFQETAGILGEQLATELLSSSHSCGHTRWAAGTGMKPDTQCGVCFGCLVRRAAFAASDLTDGTTYLHTAVPKKRQPDHLRRAARSEILTVQYAVERGARESDILAMGLPTGQSLDEALDVVTRGLNELSRLISTAPDLSNVL
jgi:hypothetical protein